VAPGLLRLWNLDTRSIRDLPWSFELTSTTFLSARPGDDTLVGIVRSNGSQSIDVVAVPLSEGSSPPITTTLSGRYSPARLLRRGTWLALAPNSTTGGEPLLVVDVRAGKPLGSFPVEFESWTLVDGEHPRLVRLVGPRSCRKLEITDLDTASPTDVPLPGCAGGLRAWGHDTSFVIVGVAPSSEFAVDVRTGKTALLTAGPFGEDFVGSAFYSANPGQQELLAIDPLSGRRWTAATDSEQIRSAVGVPAARKVVMVDEQRRVLTFDVDSRQIQACQ